MIDREVFIERIKILYYWFNILVANDLSRYFILRKHQLMCILACTRYFTSRVKRKIRYLSIKFSTRRQGLKVFPIKEQIVFSSSQRDTFKRTIRSTILQSKAKPFKALLSRMNRDAKPSSEKRTLAREFNVNFNVPSGQNYTA